MREPTPMSWENWAFDNGAYYYWKQGRNFQKDDYLKRLEVAFNNGEPDFAVIPDLPTKGINSLEYSLKWLDSGYLPKEFNWYLAVQDGMVLSDIEPIIHRFDGIFLGGDDQFKYTGFYWCSLAHKNNKKFHFGRAGTPKKILYAREINSDSSDSTFPLWTKRRQERTVKLLNNKIQNRLVGVDHSSITPKEFNYLQNKTKSQKRYFSINEKNNHSYKKQTNLI